METLQQERELKMIHKLEIQSLLTEVRDSSGPSLVDDHEARPCVQHHKHRSIPRLNEVQPEPLHVPSSQFGAANFGAGVFAGALTHTEHNMVGLRFCRPNLQSNTLFTTYYDQPASPIDVFPSLGLPMQQPEPHFMPSQHFQSLNLPFNALLQAANNGPGLHQASLGGQFAAGGLHKSASATSFSYQAVSAGGVGPASHFSMSSAPPKRRKSTATLLTL